MKKKALLWMFICAASLLCGIFFVGCGVESDETIGVNFYIGNERVSYRIVSPDDSINFPFVKCAEGYYNDGWYFDRGIWQKEYSSDALRDYIQRGIGSVDLYAKVTPFSYTITYLNTGTADTSAFPKKFDIESGTIVLPQSVPKTCHVFTGWTMDGSPVSAIDPTTTHDVTVTANFDVRHEDIHVDYGYPATCTEDGLSDGRYCTVCHEVLATQDVVRALGHDYQPQWDWKGTESATVTLTCSRDLSHTQTMTAQISSVYSAPTCTAEEKTTYTASVFFEGKTYHNSKEIFGSKLPHVFIPQGGDKVNHICQTCRQSFPHTDDDFDGVCNACGMTFETIHQISDGRQLLEIDNDPTATYVLVDDITLTGEWGGVCANIPFAGKFYGNGKTISGLHFSVTADCALIVNNAGVIDGVTLANISLSSGNANVTIGGIVAHNYGTISHCTIKGNNRIDHSANWNLQDNASRQCTFIGGAICGENHEKGEISGCSVEGTMSNTFLTKCYAYHNGIPSIDPTARVTDNLFYGNVAGKNSGSIYETDVTCANSISMTANAGGKYEVDGAAATLNCSVGSFVGQNNSSIRDCGARASIITATKEADGKYKSSATINAKEAPMYEGILGEQKGTITGFHTV